MAPSDPTPADPHPDLPPPAPGRRTRPADSLGRAPTLDLRRASGLNLWVRVERQTDRDALVHRLAQLDGRLEALSEERRAIVDALTDLRDELYPPVPWARGRRPPDLDRSPLPPAPAGSQPLGGRDLRGTCLTILRRHGALTLYELHGLLHRYGYLIASRRPVTALSDAMAYEVERQRARRVQRGVYEATDEAPGRRIAAEPGGVWRTQQPSPLDPDLDEDPTTWTVIDPERFRGPQDPSLTCGHGRC